MSLSISLMPNICPLCAHTKLQKSWLSTEFLQKVFDFYECRQCRSLVCSPMPDNETLLQMYSDDYFEADESNMFDQVTGYLKTIERGIFLDYGCGSGRFAETINNEGWQTIGLEFNPQTVDRLRKTYPFEIVCVGETPSVKADVIHLADVLEHLTELETQFAEILSLLKPGGIIIAHGPLEANPNLFQQFIKLARKLRGGATQTAPYHVTLATTRGQRTLFERFGLKEIVFEVRQIDFPAPENLADTQGIRQVGLYFIRKISRFVSSKNNGNHYFFIGRKA